MGTNLRGGCTNGSIDKRSNCFHITYEDVLGKSSTLGDMFRFLDVEYDELMVDSVLAVPHSYKSTRQNV